MLLRAVATERGTTMDELRKSLPVMRPDESDLSEDVDLARDLFEESKRRQRDAGTYI